MTEHIFKLPDLGEGTVESEIGEWFVNVGDNVVEEDVVATMMTDKAAVELSSPVSGKVIRLAGEPGDIVAVGAPLIVFSTDAEAAALDAADATGSADASGDDVAVPPTTQAAADKADIVDSAGSKVVTSPAIRRRAREAGIDLAQVPEVALVGEFCVATSMSFCGLRPEVPRYRCRCRSLPTSR